VETKESLKKLGLFLTKHLASHTSCVVGEKDGRSENNRRESKKPHEKAKERVWSNDERKQEEE